MGDFLQLQCLNLEGINIDHLRVVSYFKFWYCNMDYKHFQLFVNIKFDIDFFINLVDQNIQDP